MHVYGNLLVYKYLREKRLISSGEPAKAWLCARVRRRHKERHPAVLFEGAQLGKLDKVNLFPGFQLYIHACLRGPRTRQTYVQHLVSRQHAKVWELLRDPRCHVYVCGDSTMGEEVKAEVRVYLCLVPVLRFLPRVSHETRLVLMLLWRAQGNARVFFFGKDEAFAAISICPLCIKAFPIPHNCCKSVGGSSVDSRSTDPRISPGCSCVWSGAEPRSRCLLGGVGIEHA